MSRCPGDAHVNMQSMSTCPGHVRVPCMSGRSMSRCVWKEWDAFKDKATEVSPPKPHPCPAAAGMAPVGQLASLLQQADASVLLNFCHVKTAP